MRQGVVGSMPTGVYDAMRTRGEARGQDALLGEA